VWPKEIMEAPSRVSRIAGLFMEETIPAASLFIS
jgi:hypothetical protein